MVYNPSTQLTEHFSMKEVARSYTADRNNIDNTPPEIALERAQTLSKYVLEPIRAEFRAFRPSSWFRCETLERMITVGAFTKWAIRNSYFEPEDRWNTYFAKKSHPKGEAADIEIAGLSNDDLYNWIKSNLEYDQLIREYAKEDDPMSGWVHVSFSKGNNRNENFKLG